MRTLSFALLASALVLAPQLFAQGTVYRSEPRKPRLLIPLLSDSLQQRWQREGILRMAPTDSAFSARVVSAINMVDCRMPVARLDSAHGSAALKHDIFAGTRERDSMAIIVPPASCLKQR